jgi:hypothetical protein
MKNHQHVHLVHIVVLKGFFQIKSLCNPPLTKQATGDTGRKPLHPPDAGLNRTAPAQWRRPTARAALTTSGNGWR